MTSDDVVLRFQWKDKCGAVWNVEFSEYPGSLFGYAESRQVYGKGVVFVQTSDIHSQKQSIARLNDVQVDSPIENRGLGSMLVRKVIEECKRRGHKGVDGYLSSVDRDHFQKLKYFYQKLGFSVALYTEEHPDYQISRVGKIEMDFENVQGAATQANDWED